MKKIILLITLQLTILFSGSFVMTPGQPLVKSDEETSSATDIVNTTEATTTPVSSDSLDFTEQALPTTPYDVTQYGATCNGTTDDTSAFNTIASNTSITNWYIPAGKTCRLYGISVPEHVKAIYGGGAIKTLTKNVTSSEGPIFQVNAHSGYVIDGITFVGDGQSGSNITYMYGFIALASTTATAGGAIRNIEIRNCYFNASNDIKSGDFGRDGVIIYGDADVGSTRNVWIHNNKFQYIKGAGMEILHRSATRDPEGVNNGLYNTLVENNDFAGQGWCGISMSQVRSKCVIRNNKFHGNWNWGLEVNQARNVYAYNNEFKEIRSDFISMGGKGWHTPEYDDDNSPNINYIYNNHMDDSSALLMIYGGSSSEIHDNYIRGTIYYQPRDGSNNTANIYSNTHVQDVDNVSYYSLTAYNVSSALYDATNYAGSVGHYDNNIVYSNNNRVSIKLHGSMTNTYSAKNNTIYHTGSLSCIDTAGSSAVTTGNTCTQNYTGSIPTSRSGAGLSDPNNVGVQ